MRYTLNLSKLDHTLSILNQMGDLYRLQTLGQVVDTSDEKSPGSFPIRALSFNDNGEPVVIVERMIRNRCGNDEIISIRLKQHEFDPNTWDLVEEIG